MLLHSHGRFAGTLLRLAACQPPLRGAGDGFHVWILDVAVDVITEIRADSTVPMPLSRGVALVIIDLLTSVEGKHQFERNDNTSPTRSDCNSVPEPLMRQVGFNYAKWTLHFARRT